MTCPIWTHLFSSEPKADSALFHNRICSMAGLDFCVDCYIPPRERAIPDIMISLAAPYKRAAVLLEELPHLFLVLRHYSAILSIRSA